MADIKPADNPAQPTGEGLRLGIEMLYFVYRDINAEANHLFTRYGYGRAHHRVIYCIGRYPGLSVIRLLVS